MSSRANNFYGIKIYLVTILLIKYSGFVVVTSYGRTYNARTHTIDIIIFILTKMMLPDRFIEKIRRTSNSRGKNF